MAKKLAISVLAGLMLSGCGSSVPSEIVGAWEEKLAERTIRLVVEPDGSWKKFGLWIGPMQGKMQALGHQLEVTVTSPMQLVERCEVEVTSDELHLFGCQTGGTYQRVK